MRNRWYSFLLVFVFLLGAFVFQIGFESNETEALVIAPPRIDPIVNLQFESTGDYLVWYAPESDYTLNKYSVRYFTGPVPLHTEEFDRTDFGGCAIETVNPDCAQTMNESFVAGGYNRVKIGPSADTQSWIVVAYDVNGNVSPISNVVTLNNGEVTQPYDVDQSRAWVSNGLLYWYPPENIYEYQFSYYSGRTTSSAGYNRCYPGVLDFEDIKLDYEYETCYFMQPIDMDFVPNELEVMDFDDYPHLTNYGGFTMRVEGFDIDGNKIMDHYGDFVQLGDVSVPYPSLPEVDNLSFIGVDTLSWTAPIETNYIGEYHIGFITGRSTDPAPSSNRAGCLYEAGFCGYYRSDSTSVTSNFVVSRPGNTYYVYYEAADGRISPIAGPVYVPITETVDYFNDIENYPYRSAINELAALGVVEGFSDGSYRPYNPISRAAFTKILVLSAYWDEYWQSEQYYHGSCFVDVPADQWYTPYICFAEARGLVGGYPDGTFQPFRSIAGAEATKIVMEGYGLAPSDAEGYEGNWYYPYLRDAAALGMMVDTVGNSYWTTYQDYAGWSMNRGEIARLIQLTGLAWDRIY